MSRSAEMTWLLVWNQKTDQMLGVFLLHSDGIHTSWYDQKMWLDVGLVWGTPILFSLFNMKEISSVRMLCLYLTLEPNSNRQPAAVVWHFPAKSMLCHQNGQHGKLQNNRTYTDTKLSWRNFGQYNLKKIYASCLPFIKEKEKKEKSSYVD